MLYSQGVTVYHGWCRMSHNEGVMHLGYILWHIEGNQKSAIFLFLRFNICFITCKYKLCRWGATASLLLRHCQLHYCHCVWAWTRWWLCAGASSVMSANRALRGDGQQADGHGKGDSESESEHERYGARENWGERELVAWRRAGIVYLATWQSQCDLDVWPVSDLPSWCAAERQWECAVGVLTDSDHLKARQGMTPKGLLIPGDKLESGTTQRHHLHKNSVHKQYSISYSALFLAWVGGRDADAGELRAA